MTEPEVDFVRVKVPWGGERVDLMRLADGRVACCICFEFCTRDKLYRDASGQVWDMCQACGEHEARWDAMTPEERAAERALMARYTDEENG